MGLLESGIQMFSSFLGKKGETPSSSPATGNPFFDMLLNMKNGEKAKAATEIKENAEKSRESLFGEVWESVLARYFPNVSKLMDLASMVGITQKDPEAVPWQNEFENITALTLFIPDSFLHHITDWFANSETFLKILENWPIHGKAMADKIRQGKDPDDVINALRMMHQDMITGKVSFDKVRSAI
jgi:hypothetical protein